MLLISATDTGDGKHTVFLVSGGCGGTSVVHNVFTAERLHKIVIVGERTNGAYGVSESTGLTGGGIKSVGESVILECTAIDDEVYLVICGSDDLVYKPFVIESTDLLFSICDNREKLVALSVSHMSVG